MCVAMDSAKHESACWVQDLLPCISVVVDRVSVTTTVGQSDLYVVQASDDLKKWEEILHSCTVRCTEYIRCIV